MAQSGRVIDYAEDRDLDRLVSWAQAHNVCFNRAKCKVIPRGTKAVSHTYRLRGSILGSGDSDKDLGVMLHIISHDAVAKRANAVVLNQGSGAP